MFMDKYEERLKLGSKDNNLIPFEFGKWIKGVSDLLGIKLENANFRFKKF